MREWPEFRLTDIAAYFNGLAFKPSDWSEDGLPIIRIEQLNNPAGPSDRYLGEVPEVNRVRDGDLLFSWSATLKVVIWKHGDGALNQHLFKVVPKQDFELRFVFYLLDWCMDSLGAGSHGSTMKHIKRSELQKFKVRVPPVDTQKRISQVLACIDTAIEKTEALIAKHQQIKAGLMHDLFTRGVLPNGQLRPPRSEAPELYQETAMGWIPCDWRVAPMDSTLSRVIDYRGKTPEKTVSGVPLITAKNVRMGYIDPEPREFIAESDYARWMTRGIPGKGDVLFTTEAPLGNVAQVPTDEHMAYAQRAIILQPALHIDAAFLAYRLMTEETQQAIQRLASGSTALGIKQSEFRKVLVAYPFNKQEQVDVVRRMQVVDVFLDAQGNNRWKLQKQKLGLMQDLLTGRVPVPVPPEPAEAAA